MKDIILVDPHTEGHHLSYIRIYATAFASLGCKVSVLSPDASGVRNYLSRSSGVGDLVDVYDLPRRKISAFESRNIRRSGVLSEVIKSYFSFKEFLHIRSSIKRNGLNRASLIFILWLDSYLAKFLPGVLVDLVLPHDFAGLYFHPRIIRDHKYGNIPFFIPLSSRKLRFVGLFDERATLRLRALYGRDIFATLPDVAEKNPADMTDKLVQRVLRNAGNRKIVSLVGSLEKRKNLLSFFRAAKLSAGEVFFVCAGKFYQDLFTAEELEEVDAIVQGCSDRLFFSGNYIDSDGVFDALISISSVVFAAYVNFPSNSNMLFKASSHEVPLIVSRGQLMGELVDHYNLGVSIENCEPAVILEAIKTLLSQNSVFGFKRFIVEHSFEQLTEKLDRFVLRGG